MLILGRKEGEALLIGDDIRISVLAIEKPGAFGHRCSEKHFHPAQRTAQRHGF